MIAYFNSQITARDRAHCFIEENGEAPFQIETREGFLAVHPSAKVPGAFQATWFVQAVRGDENSPAIEEIQFPARDIVREDYEELLADLVIAEGIDLDNAELYEIELV